MSSPTPASCSVKLSTNNRATSSSNSGSRVRVMRLAREMETPIMGLPDQKGPAPVAAWGMTAEDGLYEKTKKSKNPKNPRWDFRRVFKLSDRSGCFKVILASRGFPEGEIRFSI